MKDVYLFPLIIALSLLTGCGPRENDKYKPQHEEATIKSAEDHAGSKLTLNEGKKWKLDAATKENIRLMKQTFDQAVAANKPDYAALADRLQSATDKLVSECKMSGTDHDMLHIWLTNYLSSLKDLKSTDTTLQKSAFNKIEEDLKSFDLYFE